MTIEERVENLEMAIRRIADAVFTRSIIVVDKNSGSRAELRGSGLTMYDENGILRAMLSVSGGQLWLTLYDEKGIPRAMLDVKGGKPGLALCDENGKTRAILGSSKLVYSDGSEIQYPESSMILLGPDGKVRWSAP